MNEKKPLTYADLVPQEVSFTLRSMPNVQLKLHPITLDDENWLQREFPNLQQDIATLKMSVIARIVWRLLTEDSKAFFPASEVTVMNEEGHKAKVSVGGVTLLATRVQGTQDKLDLVKVLLECIGFSRPVTDEIFKTKELGQKKSQKSEQLIGQSSLISSAPNTDGAPNTFGQEP